LKRPPLDLEILVHVPEQQAARSAPPVEPPCRPWRRRAHACIAPHAQTSTRKAMFLITIPAGS
jgi:hypothetical protein